jgi:hypothetical protein
MTLPLIRQGAGWQGILDEQAATNRRHERLRRILDQATEPEAQATPGRSTLPGDSRKLRGVPVIAPGVSGHIPGSRPDR